MPPVPARKPACSSFRGSLGATPTATALPLRSPESYTLKHLAEKILTSSTALEGERKHVTVLFADLKGSIELHRHPRC